MYSCSWVNRVHAPALLCPWPVSINQKSSNDQAIASMDYEIRLFVEQRPASARDRLPEPVSQDDAVGLRIKELTLGPLPNRFDRLRFTACSSKKEKQQGMEKGGIKDPNGDKWSDQITTKAAWCLELLLSSVPICRNHHQALRIWPRGIIVRCRSGLGKALCLPTRQVPRLQTKEWFFPIEVQKTGGGWKGERKGPTQHELPACQNA